MYEIPVGLGIVPDRTLANVALAPDALLLFVMSLGRRCWPSWPSRASWRKGQARAA